MMNGGPSCLEKEAKFFKVLVEGFAEKMSIPKAFIEKMPEGLSGTVILRGPSGDCWPVRLSRTSKRTYLAGGWEAFVKHHSLIEGEFLVFSSARSMHFDVKIFGKNGCNRGDALTVQASLGLTGRQLKRKTQSPPRRQRDAGKITSLSKPEVREVNEAAHNFARSAVNVNPYFVILIRNYFLNRQNYLLVPAFFVREHLSKSQKMKLRGPDGREWSVQFYYGLPRSPSRIWCGWIEFAAANQIKEGDSCVFELVRKDTLQMHIFRC